MSPAPQPRPAKTALQELAASGGSAPARVLLLAGRALRSAHGEPAEVERIVSAAMARLTANEIVLALTKLVPATLGDRLEQGAEEAFELAFAEEDERSTWASAAVEALVSRDDAESAVVAARSAAAGRSAIANALETAQGTLHEVDRRQRSLARRYTVLNAERRARRDALRPEDARPLEASDPGCAEDGRAASELDVCCTDPEV